MRTAVLLYDGPNNLNLTKSAVYSHMADFISAELDGCLKIRFDSLDSLLVELESGNINVVVTTAQMSRETALCLRGLDIVVVLLGEADIIGDLVDISIDPFIKLPMSSLGGPAFLLKSTWECVSPEKVAEELSIDSCELATLVSANFAEYSIIDCISLCRKLEWDSDFFGFPVAYVSSFRLTPSIEKQVRSFAASHETRFLEYRCNCHDPVSIQTAESNGYHFVDVRMTFGRSIREIAAGEAVSSLPPGISIRRATPEDCDRVVPIAEDLYRDSRYYFDGNFGLDALKTFYCDWLHKAILGKFDDFAMVVWERGDPIGFCTLRQRRDNPRNAVIGLFGIAEKYTGRGFARLLIHHVFRELRALEVDSVDVVTQGRNYRAQQLYQRVGFTTKSVELWYHKWL